MNKLILILLISITVCVVRIKLEENDLIRVNNINSKSSEELGNDIFFTFCMNLINDPEYEELVKEFLNEFPDDVSNVEVGLEICSKLAEMDEFKQLVEIAKENKNQLPVLYDSKSTLTINKKFNRLTLIEDELSPILRKGFWSKLWNAIKTPLCHIAIEVFCYYVPFARIVAPYAHEAC